MVGFFERVRPVLYWGLDALKGGAVRNHYRDIAYLLETPSRQEASQQTQAYLRRILDHAAASTPRYRSLGPGAPLEQFPVVNKGIIKDNQDPFLADSHRGRPLHRTTTSGSTGTPFTVFQDGVKRSRHQADNIYFCERAGYAFGTRLYYLRIWNEVNRKGLLTRVLQNLVPQETGDLSGPNLDRLLDLLARDGSTKSVLAFSSTYEALANHIKDRGALPHGIRVQTLMTMSEAMPDPAKKFLAEALGCPVVSRYSNMENGFLAQQCLEENNEFHLNTASYHVELLDLHKDEPVPFGTLGRIVVTDLFNFAMPLIRYDTGDTGVMAERGLCGKPGPVLQRVEGRRVDFLSDTQGRLRSPYEIVNTMWKYAEIRQFQFIQEGAGDYRMLVNTGDGTFPREEELRRDLRGYLGADARIAFECVTEVPTYASGKRKKVVNNYRVQP